MFARLAAGFAGWNRWHGERHVKAPTGQRLSRTGQRGAWRKLGHRYDLCATVNGAACCGDSRPVPQEVEHRGTRAYRAAGTGNDG